MVHLWVITLAIDLMHCVIAIQFVMLYSKMITNTLF